MDDSWADKLTAYLAAGRLDHPTPEQLARIRANMLQHGYRPETVDEHVATIPYDLNHRSFLFDSDNPVNIHDHTAIAGVPGIVEMYEDAFMHRVYLWGDPIDWAAELHALLLDRANLARDRTRWLNVQMHISRESNLAAVNGIVDLSGFAAECAKFQHPMRVVKLHIVVTANTACELRGLTAFRHLIKLKIENRGTHALQGATTPLFVTAGTDGDDDGPLLPELRVIDLHGPLFTHELADAPLSRIMPRLSALYIRNGGALRLAGVQPAANTDGNAQPAQPTVGALDDLPELRVIELNSCGMIGADAAGTGEAHTIFTLPVCRAPLLYRVRLDYVPALPVVPVALIARDIWFSENVSWATRIPFLLANYPHAEQGGVRARTYNVRRVKTYQRVRAQQQQHQNALLVATAHIRRQHGYIGRLAEGLPRLPVLPPEILYKAMEDNGLFDPIERRVCVG